MNPVWFQKEGRLFVQVGQFEAFELVPIWGQAPDMWSWHALPWEYFSRLRVSQLERAAQPEQERAREPDPFKAVMELGEAIKRQQADTGPTAHTTECDAQGPYAMCICRTFEPATPIGQMSEQEHYQNWLDTPAKYCTSCGSKQTYDQFNFDQDCNCGGGQFSERS